MVAINFNIEDYPAWPFSSQLAHLRRLVRHARQDNHAERFYDRAKGEWAYKPAGLPLDDARLSAHLNGGPHLGVYLVQPGTDVTQSAAYDLDDHDGTLDRETMRDVARRLVAAARAAGLYAMPVRSGGGSGNHLWFRWAEPQQAAAVRALMVRAVESIGFKEGTGGVAAGEIEIFPKQARVPVGGMGNLLALPFARASVPLDPDSMKAPLSHPVYEWRASKSVSSPEREQHTDNGHDHSDGSLPVESLDKEQKEDLWSALKHLCDQGHADDYDEWVKTLLALQNADCGLELYHEFSRLSPKYKEAVAQRKWDDNLGSGRSNWRTILGRAQELGWLNPRSNEAKQAPEYTQREIDRHKPRPDLYTIPGFIGRGLYYWLGAPGVGKTSTLAPIICAQARLTKNETLWPMHWRHVVVISEDCDRFEKIIRGMALFRDLIDEELEKERLHILESQRLPIKDLIKRLNKLTEQYTRTVINEKTAFPVLPLIVLDTQDANVALEEENNNTELGKVVNEIKTREITGPTWIIQHTPKSDWGKETMSARGGGAQRGNSDGEVWVYRDPNKPGRVFLEVHRTRVTVKLTILYVEPEWIEEPQPIETEEGEVQTPKYLVGREYCFETKQEKLEKAETDAFETKREKVCETINKLMLEAQVEGKEGLAFYAPNKSGGNDERPKGYMFITWDFIYPSKSHNKATKAMNERLRDDVLTRFRAEAADDDRFVLLKLSFFRTLGSIDKWGMKAQ